MKIFNLGIIFLVLLQSCVQPYERSQTSFNNHWRFNKGEKGGEEQITFKDSGWRTLNVPHDWAIEGPFSEKFDARTGGLPITGIAWYRKTFMVAANQKGNLVTFQFDGVMSNAEVYINGEKVGARPYGYIGFEVDATPFIKYGKENVIAIKVAPKELSARWYTGAGIYRNVYLTIKNPVNITYNGTYITTPSVNAQEADVVVKTTIENKNKIRRGYKIRGNYTLKTIIVDGNGNAVSEVENKIYIDANTPIEQKLKVPNPNLWDLETPYLYKAKSIVLKNGMPVDDYETTFGVRTIKYSKEKGFELNGRPVKFKGVCLHHDLGPVGSAVNYRATQRQLEIMKSIGVNAIRTSHNPPSPEQLELCDKMGILVQLEAFDEWALGKVENGYNLLWDEWHETDLRDMIKRDRNHPSVVMWSIGNEIKEQRLKNGGDLAKHLVDICHDEDPKRPVTAGFNQYPQCVKNGLAEALDLVGLNYKPTQYDNAVANNPDFIVYGSETASTVSSRGVYHLPMGNYDKHESLQISSYDIISPPWAYPPDFETYAQETIPHSLGEFVWTGFDYLGEPTPYNGKDHETHGKWGGDWPSRSSYFGIVDLCGFPKDRYYYYQSRWTTKPMVHILPHWNWENSGHKEIPVYCYTNADKAELFLNGKSLGIKVMGVDKTTIPAEFLWWKKPEKTWDSPYRLNWKVPYEPGELKVIAYKDGKTVAEKTIVTAGAPDRIELTPDRTEIDDDGNDLSFITVKIVDKDGNFCPLADNLVTFDIEGPATIAAVGNGNAATTEPFQANYRRAFNGLCMLIIKSKAGEKGTVSIMAKSENLAEAKAEINVL
ncbi:glycoside hydrolase family 2 TIM barrel-domain containing protein [Gaetbulibacter saemankumensis]|uniref:glycoside hydrolase family 2 TIM barrel-domain containing protein n=1 Tax=Gaetbulibacter saemankumensis TaxID=311208 RepID=UPI00040A0CCC|nr:glycoside hydrolase family 2 TIM barrel-domain containing protein [Gaetbulibacter saemankumensis]